MAKISLKKDYMDGNVLYGKDLNPNFETIETTINDNDDAQAETNAEVEEALTQLSSDISQAQTDIGELQTSTAGLATSISEGDASTLESAKSYTDTQLQGYAKTEEVPTKTSDLTNDSGFVTGASIPTKISQLENDDNTVKDADYVHTDNNYTDEDKTKLSNMSEYELPVATSDTLGGVKAGDGVEIESDGTLNVTGGGGSTGDGIPTLVGTQENPIKLYSINSGPISDGVPIGLCIISGYTKELVTSEVTDKFNGKLCYTSSNGHQFIGPYYNGNESDSDTFLNLVFWFRPGMIQVGTSYFSEPFIEFTYNDIITDTEQGYVTPKAVYDYVGALSSLNTTDKTSIVNAINELVNSTGTPGEDGLDYLGYYGSTIFMQEPIVGQTFEHQISKFSRTPVVGDAYIMLGSASYGNHSYLITCKVTDVSETHGTVSSKIVTFVETTGAQGSNGAQGEPGPQGPQGETGATGADGADGVTPTIGENGNWYLGETDTGKPSRGEQGLKGDTGEQGPQGLPGPTGPGVPAGGTTGQVLTKNSDTDFDTIWKTVESGGGGQGITVLVGTDESPIDFINGMQDEGIYLISGKVVRTTPGKVDTYSSPVLCFISKFMVSTESNDLIARFMFDFNGGPSLLIGGVTKGSSPMVWSEFELTPSQVFYYNGNSNKAVSERLFYNYTGLNASTNINNLQTTDKTSLVAAINELNTRLAALENPTE